MYVRLYSPVFPQRRKASSLIAMVVLFLHSSVFAQDPGPVPIVPKGDPAMKAAFAHAAAGLDEFFTKYRKPPHGSRGYSVKIGLMDTSNPPGYALAHPNDAATNFVEWFWTEGLSIEPNGGFSAPLGNDPDYLHHVKRGQVIHFTREHIGDWMYLQNGKIVGNATACPALAHASIEERRLMMERFGLNCD
jgi:uncharacterized protein YegJ (DUF2314 family)